MSFPTDYCIPQQTHGGNGGGAFNSFRPLQNSPLPTYVVCRIDCYIASQRMVGIKVYYSNAANWPTEPDGDWSGFTSDFYGATGGSLSTFIFVPGELITSLSVAKAGYDGQDYCGGLSFKTSSGRSFTAESANHGDSSSMDVGYGLCVGIYGNSGDAIDKLGLWMILPATSLAITEVVYSGNPGVALPTENYTNTQSIPVGQPAQTGSQTIQYTLTTSQTWEHSQTVQTSETLSVSVSANIYEVIDVGTSYQLTQSTTAETTNGSSYSESTDLSYPFSWALEPGYTTTYTVSHYIGSYSLPYTGLGCLTLNNRNLLSYYLSSTTTGSASSALVGVSTRIPYSG